MIYKLSQYKHLNNFLDHDVNVDQPAVMRLSIEVQDQVYEFTLDASLSYLQPLTSKLMVNR